MKVLLIKPENQTQLDLITEFLKKMEIKLSFIKQQELEDIQLAKRMDKARKTPLVSEEEVFKVLRK
jgi:hypothetical protein